jgi:hypothetical protein
MPKPLFELAKCATSAAIPWSLALMSMMDRLGTLMKEASSLLFYTPYTACVVVIVFDIVSILPLYAQSRIPDKASVVRTSIKVS